MINGLVMDYGESLFLTHTNVKFMYLFKLNGFQFHHIAMSRNKRTKSDNMSRPLTTKIQFIAFWNKRKEKN